MNRFKCLECGESLSRRGVYKRGKHFSCISCLEVTETIHNVIYKATFSSGSMTSLGSFGS